MHKNISLEKFCNAMLMVFKFLLNVFCVGQGKNPVWNEKFIFKVEYPGSINQHKLILKIMDKDLYTDDFVGEAM